MVKGAIALAVRILTSGFPYGFTKDFVLELKTHVHSGMNFAFIASEFEYAHEKTDQYFNQFMKMFFNCGVVFDRATVIDGRITGKKVKPAVSMADVIWLAGGDTPTQFDYLKSYGLVDVLKQQTGVIIGMSAGSINMAKTAICTKTCGHRELTIYEALGLVEFSVEPHFNKHNVSEELLSLSERFSFYGICDGSAIVHAGFLKCVGEVFQIQNRQVIPI